MAGVLFISGSPRNGNTDFVLNQVYDSVDQPKELILLRELDIKHCKGCLEGHETGRCSVNDDMHSLLGKLLKYDAWVIGTPNYYANVSGLLKDFIDRTNVFYGKNVLDKKQVFYVVVGGMPLRFSEKVCNEALTHFSRAHRLDVKGCWCFRAEKAGGLKNDSDAKQRIIEIIKAVKKI